MLKNRLGLIRPRTEAWACYLPGGHHNVSAIVAVRSHFFGCKYSEFTVETVFAVHIAADAEKLGGCNLYHSSRHNEADGCALGVLLPYNGTMKTKDRTVLDQTTEYRKCPK